MTGAYRIFLAFLALWFGASPAHAEGSPRVFAIGDLHGDFEAYQDIVSAAGLSDGEGRWTGGAAILVQLGDIVDRGPDSLEIQRHIRRLQREAPADGGRVIALIGNHEAMNVIGDLRYVHPGEYEAFRGRESKRRRDLVYADNRAAVEAFWAAQDPPLTPREARAKWMEETPLGKIEHRLAWRPSGEIGEWIATLPAAAKVGDTLFVHGGLSAEMTSRSIEEINAAVGAAIAAGSEDGQAILEDELGPLWYRGNVTRAAAETDTAETAARPGIAEELDIVLSAFGARRLVVAHTPSLDGIAASHGGRLIRADTGIAAHYGGPRSYLELVDGRAIAHEKQAGGDWTWRELERPPDTISAGVED